MPNLGRYVQMLGGRRPFFKRYPDKWLMIILDGSVILLIRTVTSTLCDYGSDKGRYLGLKNADREFDKQKELH